MKCIICNSKTIFYFSKKYCDPPFDAFMHHIGPISYVKCTHCGFVFSKTHSELSEAEWTELNINFHHFHESGGSSTEINQPPYIEQAMMFSLLMSSGIIDAGKTLDYAAGYGTLKKLLEKYFYINIDIFDRYVNNGETGDYVLNPQSQSYDTVINSAMFEHVLTRNDLDSVNDLISTNGSLVLHTVVCENIPKDPDWFYLRPPVHTAFHTNKSMKILMQQWGYKSSIYCLPAKSWVLLRTPVDSVQQQVAAINKELQRKWFHCKEGFVDYWKGF